MKILTNIDNLGRIVIPQILLKQSGIKKGEQVEVIEQGATIRIIKVSSKSN